METINGLRKRLEAMGVRWADVFLTWRASKDRESLSDYLQARLVEAAEGMARLEGELYASRQRESHLKTDVRDAQGAQAQFGAKVRSLAEENARMEVQVQQLTATLELLQQLALEACGDLDRRVDPQGLVRLHSFLHGNQVYSKAEQLQEQLAQAEATAKRSEGVRMELHGRVRDLERGVAAAITDLALFSQNTIMAKVRSALVRTLNPPAEDDPEEETPDTTAGPGF